MDTCDFVTASNYYFSKNNEGAKSDVYSADFIAVWLCFCWGIIYVFGEGYTGIVFVLLSWVFIFSLVMGLIGIAIKYFRKVNQ